MKRTKSKAANAVKSKSSAKSSEEITPTTRQCAWIAKKSAFARSPYAQEMYAKAEAALKNEAVKGNKEKCLGLQNESESSDDESVVVTKSRHSRKKPAAKKTKSIPKDESDGDSEYQPTQEPKKLTRSTKNRKKKVVESEDDGGHESTKRLHTEPSTKRCAAKKSTKKQQALDSENEDAPKTTTGAKRPAVKQSAAKSEQVEKPKPCSRNKVATTKSTLMTKKLDIESDEESEYHPTQCDLSIGASRADMISSPEMKATGKSKRPNETKCSTAAQESNETKRVTRSKSKKPTARGRDSANDITNDVNRVVRQNGRGSSIHQKSKGGILELGNGYETKLGGDQVLDEEEWGGAGDDVFCEQLFDNKSEDHFASVNLDNCGEVGQQKDDSRSKHAIVREQVFASNSAKSNAKVDVIDEQTRTCIELNTKSISAADQRNILAEIQKQTEDSQPSTPSNSQMLLSAVISSEKPQHMSKCASDVDKDAVLRLNTLTERLKRIKNVKQQIQLIEEEIQQEMNALLYID